MADAQDEKVRMVEQYFWLPHRLEHFLQRFDLLVIELPREYLLVCQAFRFNLGGLISVAALPYVFARDQSYFLHFQQTFLIAGFNAKATGNTNWQEEASAKTAATFNQFLESEEGQAALLDNTLSSLMSQALEKKRLSTARELTRQGVLLLWSAFEVLCRDLFIQLLNDSPNRIVDLFKSEKLKKKITAEKFDFLSLADYSYNLSSSMGDMLIRRVDMHNIGIICETFNCLFPNNQSLSTALADSRLEKLFHMRNLIIHRRGVVDAHYLKFTNDDTPIGAELIVQPAVLESLLEAVTNAVVAIIENIQPSDDHGA